MKVLIMAAHPDDEVLGVGGTILKHVSNNDEVYVCIATRAYSPHWSDEYIKGKIAEQKKVDKVLGVKGRFNLGYLTTQLNTVPHGDFNRACGEVFKKVNPDIVYTHFEHDLNYDHTLIYRASMVLSRPPEKMQVLCFETLSETEWNNKAFVPNVWVNIEKFINKKIRAFKIYKSEVKDRLHPRSKEGVKTLARKRGSEICAEYAEAFMLVRDTR